VRCESPPRPPPPWAAASHRLAFTPLPPASAPWPCSAIGPKTLPQCTWLNVQPVVTLPPLATHCPMDLPHFRSPSPLSSLPHSPQLPLLAAFQAPPPYFFTSKPLSRHSA